MGLTTYFADAPAMNPNASLIKLDKVRRSREGDEGDEAEHDACVSRMACSRIEHLTIGMQVLGQRLADARQRAGLTQAHSPQRFASTGQPWRRSKSVTVVSLPWSCHELPTRWLSAWSGSS